MNTGVTGVADDDFLMSEDPIKLQGLIDIAEHYGKRYRITYGASKTKITVSGSEIDRISASADWVLAPRSAHARPSARPPIDTPPTP